MKKTFFFFFLSKQRDGILDTVTTPEQAGPWSPAIRTQTKVYSLEFSSWEVTMEQQLGQKQTEFWVVCALFHC